MKYNKISLIIPFHNEKNKICKTVNTIMKQTELPNEVIFIDSSSKDNSKIKLNLYLKNYNFKIINKIKILKSDKKLPSASKNLGIISAKNENICFLDVGLTVNKYFIKSVKKKISPKKYSYVQGKYFFIPSGFYDKILLSQTYGIFKFGNCIPSSCFKKEIFFKYSFFKNFRSGYDKIWLKNLKKKNLNFNENFSSPVNYIENVSGLNFWQIFKKLFMYSNTTIGLEDFYTDKIYLIFFLIVILFSLNGFFFEAIILYFIYRGIFIPFKKNYKLKNKKFDPIIYFYGPIIGFIIDTARVTGFLFGYIKKLIK